MDQGSGRYTAFLSYSHKDAAVARWLHRRLETYRIPRRLVGTEGERGRVPARLTPIFRDREELPAAGDLSERVRAALAISDNLIILCSPNAAVSPWVAKEIAAFRELHPDRPIFAAIVDGEPTDCFPPNLAANGAEPLAANLRQGRDGRRLGLLKLVAGLSGVGLDALVQRDAQRRIRRVTAVTGAALATMLVMTAMTGEALRERREAQRQRAEAEGLVEFMLTDLRSRLKGAVRLDVLGAVNQRAIAYYSRQDLSTLTDESLARRARILQAMGEDDEKRGRIDRVLQEALEASRTTSALVAKKPNDPERIYNDAQSSYWIGRVDELRGDGIGALNHYVKYSEAAHRLTKISPSNPDYMMEAAWSISNIGKIQLNSIHDYVRAQRSFETAIYWFRQSTKVRPADYRAETEEADAYGWLADTFYVRNRWQDALSFRIIQYHIVNSLHYVRPNDIEITYRLALATLGVGATLVKTGNQESARSFLLFAYQRAGELSSTDPGDSEWMLLKAKVECIMLYDKFSPLAKSLSDFRIMFLNDFAALVKIYPDRAREIAGCANVVKDQTAIRGR